jgi:hypothetical protein
MARELRSLSWPWFRTQMAAGQSPRSSPLIECGRSTLRLAMCLFAVVFLSGTLLTNPAAAQSVTSVTKGVNLSFGSLIADRGGTVTIAPSSAGTRSKTGSVVLPISSQFPQGSAASFTVNATDGYSYTIGLPTTNSVTLSSGANNMTIASFSSSPSGALTTSNGVAPLYVGATLTVGSNQPAGNYSGSFSVTIIYP